MSIRRHRDALRSTPPAVEARAPRLDAPILRGESFEVVLVVHGTFANPKDPPASDLPTWWQPGGSFPKALDAALERHGSPARCHHWVLDLLESYRSLEGRRFPPWRSWSGENSEVERRRAAYALAEHLRQLQREQAIRRIHLVAHSHGGNVVRRALRFLNQPRYKLGAVVCLGTPFLHFADRAPWRRWASRVNWPVLIALPAVFLPVVWLVETLGTEARTRDVVAYLFGLFALGAIYWLWHYARTSEASSEDAPATLLCFRQDEAIRLLRGCAALAAAPHEYLRDLLGGPAVRSTAQPDQTSSAAHGWYDRAVARASNAVGRSRAHASNAWNHSVCAAAERLTRLAYRVPLLGSVCALLLIVAFRPYRPPLKPLLLSRLPRLASLFLQPLDEEAERIRQSAIAAPQATDSGPSSRLFGRSPSVEPGSPGSWYDLWKHTTLHTLTLAAWVVAALYMLLKPIDMLLGLPSWLSAVVTRFAILVGVRAAAGSVPGMDVLATAFRPSCTGCVPAEVETVVVPNAIEDDIAHRLTATNRIDVVTLGGALDPARRASLLDTVRIVFTDVGLLHQQYYQDDRIIDYVARRIADREAPHWGEGAGMG